MTVGVKDETALWGFTNDQQQDVSGLMAWIDNIGLKSLIMVFNFYFLMKFVVFV